MPIEVLTDPENGGGGQAVLAMTDAALDNVEMRSMLRPALQALPEREQIVLMLRFVAGKTQTEIAEIVGRLADAGVAADRPQPRRAARAARGRAGHRICTRSERDAAGRQFVAWASSATMIDQGQQVAGRVTRSPAASRSV